jgi:hypothetical protein
MDWPEQYAETLAGRGGLEGGSLGLDREEVGAMLRLSREVAHRTERRWAPLSTYVAGKYVAARIGQGTSVSEAVDEAIRVAEELLPERSPDGPETARA